MLLHPEQLTSVEVFFFFFLQFVISERLTLTTVLFYLRIVLVLNWDTLYSSSKHNIQRLTDVSGKSESIVVDQVSSLSFCLYLLSSKCFIQDGVSITTLY